MRYFLLLSFLVLFACANDLETVKTKDDSGYTIQYTRKKTDYAKQGKYKSFYPSGKLYEEAEYHNDTLHGQRRLYFENGQVEVLETYQHGQFVSPYRKFYESGQLKLEGAYVANKAEGVWKRYYANGQIMEIVHLQNNEEYGPFQEFYENGQLKAEGTYEGVDEDTGNPRENGLLKMYDETGELVKKMDCKLGRCYTTWKKEEGDLKKDN